MDNATIMAAHMRGMNRRLLGRFAVFAAAVTVLFALGMVLFQPQADAQINFQQIFCPILLALANAFGGFFAGFFNALLAAFGCVISG